MAVKSAADSDPYFSQRYIQQQQQRCKRFAATTAALRNMTADPEMPKSNFPKPTVPTSEAEGESKLVDPRAKLRSMMSKYV